MSAPLKDSMTVTPSGETVVKLPAGVSFHNMVTHTDERGTVCELFDPRWGWRNLPMVYAYMYTLRPGMIKGWARHHQHEDRYCLLFGEMELVLYDDRPDSPTKGLVSKIILSEHHRRLVNIPIGIWHAIRNLGLKDVIAVNFPTTPYEHEDPDKYRLPLDTDKIPHKFENPRGW